MKGELLGQYEYDEDRGYYVQASSEQSNDQYTARYLYRDEDDEWVGGPKPGGELIWLWNPNPSKKLPAGGWMFYDNALHNDWQNDPSLTVTTSSLPYSSSWVNILPKNPYLTGQKIWEKSLIAPIKC